MLQMLIKQTCLKLPWVVAVEWVVEQQGLLVVWEELLPQ